jgi:CMP-N-acetylneuraminic acid synthetase
MSAAPRLLTIVPARGGSKGVPRKNVRLLHGMPLIAHVLVALRKSRWAPEVWVSTDDEEIGEIARRYGAATLARPHELAGDLVTLDPVICHAVSEIEHRTGRGFSIVATVQPTSPLLTASRFDECIEAVASDGYDSAITVVEDRHLRWQGPLADPTPCFTARVNRQQLPPLFRETGAVLATRRCYVQPHGRFGPRVRLVELTEREAVDIDSNADWWRADNYLDRRKIAVRVDGGGAIGLGHVYRAITLSSRLFNHEVRLFMDPAQPDGIRLARDCGLHVVPTVDAEFSDDLRSFAPDVVILDVLDTSRSFVEGLRSVCDFIVTFEDLGSGADAADLVFNELYADPSADGTRRFSGPTVACLREEFYSMVPRATAESVKEILITFGGTDPSNLTMKALQALELLKERFHVTVILGLGYPDATAIEAMARASAHTVSVHRNVRNMSTWMARADLAVTSAGRTVFELIACQTPVITLAQNQRELLHTCARESYGVLSLGLGAAVQPEGIARAVAGMLPVAARRRARERMAVVDLWHGPDRILTTILSEVRARQLKLRLLEAQLGTEGQQQ